MTTHCPMTRFLPSVCPGCSAELPSVSAERNATAKFRAENRSGVTLAARGAPQPAVSARIVARLRSRLMEPVLTQNRVLTVPNMLSVIRLALIPAFVYVVLSAHANGWG